MSSDLGIFQSYSVSNHSLNLDCRGEDKQLKKIEDAKESVEEARIKLYEITSKNNFKNKMNYIINELDIYRGERRKISLLTNNYNISNAWMKCYEMLIYYDLLPRDKIISHFDNASFPGSFIVATHHYVKTVLKQDYIWYASSIINSSPEDTYLMDEYDLMNNYPQNYMMGKYDGDVRNIEYLLHLREIMKDRKVDLYTSDLGISGEYTTENQERFTTFPDFCQALLGLMVLNDGGSIILKHFSLFESRNRTLLYVLSGLFSEFHICKPMTSRTYNNEIYLVGKGYERKDEAIDFMLRYADEKKHEKFVIPISCLDNKFTEEYIYATTLLSEFKIQKINSDIRFSENATQSVRNMRDVHNYIRDNYPSKKLLDMWYDSFPLFSINPDDRLLMRDKYHQTL
jgi:hypothetical protein